MSSEQCNSDCAPGIEEIPRQAVTAPTALAASPAADHIQVGNSDVQSLENIHTGFKWFTYITKCIMSLQLNFTFICILLLDQPFMRTDFCVGVLSIFQHLCLELSATNISHQWLSVFRSTSKSRPNNIRGGKCSSVHKKFLRFQWNLVYR